MEIKKIRPFGGHNTKCYDPKRNYGNAYKIVRHYGLRFFFGRYFFPEPSKPSETDERNDSIWATVAGFVKSFNVSIEYVLYECSYENLILYSRTLPSYNSDKNKKEKDKGEVLKGRKDINEFMLKHCKK